MSRTSWRAGISLAAVGATSAALLLAAAPASVAVEAPVTDPCTVVADWSDMHANTTELLAAGQISIAGTTVTVDLDQLDLVTPPPTMTEPTRALNWRSGRWVGAAFRTVTPGTLTPTQSRLMAALLAAYGRSPDPGSATPEAMALAVTTGWDEGTNTVRERVLNCFAYATDKDPAVLAALEPTIAANLDLVRYYGPPYHRVHNHGTMANLALGESAVLLGRTDLADIAAERLTVEMPAVFSPAGFTYEQSTGYLELNQVLWSQALDLLRQRAHPADLTAISTRLAASYAMTAHLTAPSGVPVSIGDGWYTRPFPPPAAQKTLGVLDVRGGVTAWRWSWTDRATSFWTMRFGPARRAHGHLDHTSLTWSSRRQDILVDPASYNYDMTNPLTAWQGSPQAHNIAVPARPVLRTAAGLAPEPSPLLKLTRTGYLDVAVARDMQFTVPVTRTVKVDNAHALIVVTDQASGTFTQHFHLAPGWTYLGRSARTLVFGNGVHRMRLWVDRAATLVAVAGRTNPVAGWVLGPRPESSTPATEVLVTTKGAVTTALQVLS